MRLVTVIALGVFAVGAFISWATDWDIGAFNREAIGAILMICAGVVLFTVIILSPRGSASGPSGAFDDQPSDDPDGRTWVRWPRR